MRELPTNGCGSVFPNRGLVFLLSLNRLDQPLMMKRMWARYGPFQALIPASKKPSHCASFCTATISFRSHSKTQHTVLIKDNNQTCETWLQGEITQRWTWLTGIWTTYMEENDNSSLQEEVRVRSDRYINLPPCSYSITAEVTNFAINAAVRSIKLVSTSTLNAI